jgi:ribulose 1,5-bisphosphate synthetase/thiazole synthase
VAITSISADTLVNAAISAVIAIGGGIAGFLCAYTLVCIFRLGIDAVALLGCPMFFIGAIWVFVVFFRKLVRP